MSFSKLVFAPFSYIGWGALAQLIPEVKKIGPQKILIVTDPMLEKIGLVQQVKAPLVEAGYNVEVYTGVVPEPPVAVGEALVAYTREHGFDLLIGVGGGSALDLTKLAAVLAPLEGNVRDYMNLSGNRTPAHRGIPKILIPTTSGTGSEVTNVTVLSLETAKDVVVHDYMLADVAIVDPQLTLSLPPRITAAT
ncbi:MAG: iron-containing alcohol dehydrogenase, partial [Clostridia bacterium]